MKGDKISLDFGEFAGIENARSPPRKWLLRVNVESQTNGRDVTCLFKAMSGIRRNQEDPSPLHRDRDITEMLQPATPQVEEDLGEAVPVFAETFYPGHVLIKGDTPDAKPRPADLQVFEKD